MIHEFYFIKDDNEIFFVMRKIKEVGYFEIYGISLNLEDSSVTEDEIDDIDFCDYINKSGSTEKKKYLDGSTNYWKNIDIDDINSKKMIIGIFKL